MKTIEIMVKAEIEIESGKAQDVADGIVGMLDGYQPSGGNLDFTVTESQLVSLRRTD